MVFKTTFALEVWYIMTIICTIWQYKSILYVKFHQLENKILIVISFCKAINLVQIDAFLKNLLKFTWRCGFSIL